jgi:tRNA threonylcarbamoyl adenosine modification protein YeaZ
MELAIDTSSNNVGIALSEKGETLASLVWQTRQNHTMELLPNLVCLLRQMGVGLKSIQGIIVARGPGSFNGLRVGMSTAKGLAFSLSIPLLGVNTFEAEACLFAFIGLPVRPVHKAGGNEISTALYREKNNGLQRLEQENIATVGALCRRTRQRTVFCGEIPSSVVTELRQNLGSRAIIPQTGNVHRVTSLAVLGWQKLSKGDQDDPAALQPLYLRPPHITEPRKRVPFLRRSTKRQEQANGNS